MSKANAKTAENIEYAAFDANNQFRAFAEKGIEQTRETCARMKSGYEESQKAFEKSFESARAFGDAFAVKSVEAMRHSAEANFAHLESLFGAKSLSEVMELNSAFLRKSVDMSIDRAKQFQSLSTDAAADVAKPMKAVFEKVVEEPKAA